MPSEKTSTFKKLGKFACNVYKGYQEGFATMQNRERWTLAGLMGANIAALPFFSDTVCPSLLFGSIPPYLLLPVLPSIKKETPAKHIFRVYSSVFAMGGLYFAAAILPPYIYQAFQPLEKDESAIINNIVVKHSWTKGMRVSGKLKGNPMTIEIVDVYNKTEDGEPKQEVVLSIQTTKPNFWTGKPEQVNVHQTGPSHPAPM